MSDQPDATRPDPVPPEPAPKSDPKLAARDADEPMSQVQRTTLRTLCEEARVPFDERLSTAAAARRITELQKAKDRGTEAVRSARGQPTEALPSAAGEEDPGAALDAPGTRRAIEGNAAASG